MRKFLIGFLMLILIAPLAGAREMRTDPSIEVTAGNIDRDGMLGTSGGEVFLEFSNGVRFLNGEDRTLFSGEILPPAVIPLPAQSPRTRMDELATFELVADTGTEVLFVDAFDTLHHRNQLREQYLNPDLKRDGWVQLLMPIDDVLVQEPKLWEFLGEDEGWIRRGGRVESTEYDDVRVFAAKITRTGVYGIFDEDPLPSTFATNWEILTEPESMHDPAGLDLTPEEVVIPSFISDDPTLGYPEESDPGLILDVTAPEVQPESGPLVEAFAPLANQPISPMSPNFGESDVVPAAAPVVMLSDPILSGGNIDLQSGGSAVPDHGAVTLIDDAPTDISPPPGATLPSTGISEDAGEKASGWMIVVLAGIVFVIGASVLLAFKKPAHRG